MPPGEAPFPEIGHEPAARHQRITPGVIGIDQPAARGNFPFGLARQSCACPIGEGLRIGLADMRDGVILLAVAPARGLGKAPPSAGVVQVDRAIGHREQARSARVFGSGDMAGRGHEGGEGFYRHGRCRDLESGERNLPRRTLLRIMTIRSDLPCPRRNRDTRAPGLKQTAPRTRSRRALHRRSRARRRRVRHSDHAVPSDTWPDRGRAPAPKRVRRFR